MGGPRTSRDLDARRSMNADWSDREIAKLRALWPDRSLSSRMIAAQIPGRSHNSVVKRAHRLGLEPRGSPLKPGTAKPKQPKAKALPRGATTLAPLGSLG